MEYLRSAGKNLHVYKDMEQLLGAIMFVQELLKPDIVNTIER